MTYSRHGVTWYGLVRLGPAWRGWAWHQHGATAPELSIWPGAAVPGRVRQGAAGPGRAGQGNITRFGGKLSIRRGRPGSGSPWPGRARRAKAPTREDSLPKLSIWQGSARLGMAWQGKVRLGQAGHQHRPSGRKI